ncbi:MAG: hypothetical protein V4550_00380 [Gemmatimonadota bacterium]
MLHHRNPLRPRLTCIASLAFAAVAGSCGGDGVSPEGGVTLVASAAASIATGQLVTCALTSVGQGYCWGANNLSQLGTGSTSDAPAPAALAGTGTYQAIDVGVGVSCALGRDGIAYCWGQSSGVTNAQPTAIISPVKFAQLATGGPTSCGLTAEGAAYCWGGNQYGQVGNNSVDVQANPVPVATTLKFTSISVGLIHACALTSSNDAYCWGHNGYGQLGIASTLAISTVPVLVAGGIKFKMISAGGAYTCGVTTAGAGFCWGLNNSRQLGAALAQAQTPTPYPVSGNVVFASIQAGNANNINMPTCGISTDAELYCWGYTKDGQTGGTGTIQCSAVSGIPSDPLDCVLSPTKVAGVAKVVAVSPTASHTCAMLEDRRVACWGDNSRGQLGTGTTISSSVPVIVRTF